MIFRALYMQTVDLYARNVVTSTAVKELLARKQVLNSQVHVVSNPTSETGAFDHGQYFSFLRTRNIGDVIVHSRKLKSTSDFLSENLELFPLGTVCVCDEQLAGRGRGENVWQSPLGSLAFSFTCATKLSASDIPLMQYVSTLAVVKAIEDACYEAGCMDYAGLGIRIKWPNDIYYKTTKLGGVLCRAIYQEASFRTIVGIGLNLNNASPTVCLSGIVREKEHMFRVEDHGPVWNTARTSALVDQKDEEVHPLFMRERLIPRILEHFELVHESIETVGFCAVRDEYLKYWLHSGTCLSVLDASGSDASVTVVGLTDAGLLLAGEVNEISSQ